MRLTKVTISGLFGLFDHEIPIHDDERMTIIHGPNGIGKTTILRLIHALLSGRLGQLSSIPFQSVSLKFDDTGTLSVTQTDVPPSGTRRHSTPRASRPLKIEYSKRGMKKKAFDFDDQSSDGRGPHRSIRRMEEFIPFLQRIGPRRWRDGRTGASLSLDDVIREYSDFLPDSVRDQLQPRPDWLTRIAGQIPIHFIQTQRLLSANESRSPQGGSEEPMKPTVVLYAEQMARIIQETLAQSASQSQSLDRSFAGRVLQRRSPQAIGEDEIRSRYREQMQKRNRLMKVGLLAMEEPVALPRRDLESFEQKVLGYYVDDADQKLAVFDDLLARLELFSDLIDARFLYKSVHIDRTRGFTFMSSQGEDVELTTLSSGEQHELVLAFELLFQVEKGSLILIDEPEISLHVTWQQRFLDDLLRIAELSDFNFIVATHSPQIIHDRWNLAVALSESEME